MLQPQRMTEIEQAANEWRRGLGIDSLNTPDMVGVIEQICMKLGVAMTIKRDAEMPKAEALANVPGKQLDVPCSVYANAQRGEPRARFTMAHEVGHFLLRHDGYTARSIAKTEMYNDAASRRQEDEANYFAECFLAPFHLAKNCSGSAEIAEKFQLSDQAAQIAWERTEARKRRLAGEVRELPPGVANFLAEREKRGDTLKSKLPDRLRTRNTDDEQ